MIIIAASGLFSLVLAIVAIYLSTRASVLRPAHHGATKPRSPEAYAFQQRRAVIRRQGRVCALAAVLTLGVCAAMGLVRATYDTN